jgi:hypothetical protein
MAWAALGKAAMGAVKGKAKQIATDKLLNRKKKTDARRASAQKVMGQDSGAGEEKGGAIVKAQISPLPLAKSTEAIGKTPAAGGGEGGSEQIQGTLLKIKTSVISVDTLLKGSFTLQQKQLEQQRKSEEKVDDAAAEEDLEKDKKKKGGPNVGKLVPKQVKSLWAKLLDFFTGIILGWVMVRMVDFLPALQKAVPIIAGAIDFLAKIAVGAVNILGTFVDGAYKFVNFMQGMVKNIFGEEGAKKFGIFMENLKNLFQGFLIWKVIGEKIFKAVVANIQRTWKILKGAITRAFKIAKNILKGVGGLINKLTGGLAGKLAKDVAGKLASGLQWGKNIGGKALSKVGGLLSKGGGAAAGKVSALASKFLGPAAKTLGPIMKTVGPKIAKFAGRIPILGPLIVGVVSIMSGEPPGQAIFKALGAALGGALGSFIPIPVVGTLLGETIGVFVGDLIYELILGGGIDAVGKKLKDTFKTFIEPIYNFFKDGIARMIENFPTIPIPDIRPGDLIGNVLQNIPGGAKFLSVEIPNWVPFIGGWSVVKALRTLPGVQEILGFIAQFIPGLNKYVEGGRLLKIPNLFMLSPPGIPFLAKHIASSFLPGIFPAGGSSAPVDKVGKPAAVTAKSVKEKKKEEEKKKQKEAWEKAKKKVGKVVEGVKDFGKNVFGGLKDLTKGMFSSVPDGYKLVKIGEDGGGGGLRGLFGKDKKDDKIFPKRSTSDKVGGKISKRERDKFIMSETPRYNDPKANALWEKAENNAGIGQLEQFAFYENPEGGGGVIIKEVPIIAGGGASPAPAEESAPASQGGGKSASPFMALYRGDG